MKMNLLILKIFQLKIWIKILLTKISLSVILWEKYFIYKHGSRHGVLLILLMIN